MVKYGGSDTDLDILDQWFRTSRRFGGSVTNWRGDCFGVVAKRMKKLYAQIRFLHLLDSKMIFCGDSYQIDLKDKNWSAYHDMAKLTASNFVFKTVLEDSHRHNAIDDLLELLNGYH